MSSFSSLPPGPPRLAVVTGANGGVGYETTLGLARAGFEVIMACRDIEKANRARQRMLGERSEYRLTPSFIDLGNFASVRGFADRYRREHGRLNLLVNNAGVLKYGGERNAEGIELQLATNHLGHFLLTSLLIDLLPDEPSSRVVSVSSVAHKRARLAIEDLNFERPSSKSGGAAYAQSKLACLMFALELDRRLRRAGRQLLSVCAHPGVTTSGLFEDMPRLRHLALDLFAPLLTHSAADAAKPLLHAALARDVEGGEYIGPQGVAELKGPPGPAEASSYARDASLAAHLWKISTDMTGARWPSDLTTRPLETGPFPPRADGPPSSQSAPNPPRSG